MKKSKYNVLVKRKVSMHNKTVLQPKPEGESLSGKVSIKSSFVKSQVSKTKGSKNNNKRTKIG